MNGRRLFEQADRQGSRGGYHRALKRQKARAERRAAKRDPEAIPCYKKYCGYET